MTSNLPAVYKLVYRQKRRAGWSILASATEAALQAVAVSRLPEAEQERWLKAARLFEEITERAEGFKDLRDQ